ncbi:unnamed protein product [Leptidea sinapis]|uniref:Phospholipase B-like n=1 Tax=Leptidea sinapis TaxID=189913 RepID=A0A5E4Q4J7_9NEOP|nr:unnamed protein product [Leptidea sinapis]
MTKILKVVGASWLQTKISSYILGLLGVLAILALFVGQIERIKEDGNYAATVFYSEKTGYSIEYWGQSNELANIPRGVARAYFRGEIDTVGWSLLEIETNGTYPDEVQAYAAGIVEGALTWYLIHIHLENTIRAKCEDRPIERQCDKLRDHLDRSANIWKTYAADRSSTDPFWHHKEYETDISDLYWLNFVSEVMEVQDKLNISLVDPTLNMLPGLSSAFVRVAGDDAEKKLFVPIGPRISAANHLATNVSSWGHLIARSNSGTACKQWLVVDFNKFDSLRHINVDVHTEDKKEVIKETMVNNDTRHTIVHRAGSGRTKGLMWLIEQIPGRTHSADISDAFLERQYWATYGLPYFKSPRSRAFERGFKNATSVKSILKLMRVNNITALNSSSAHCDNCLLNKTAYSVLGMRGDIIEEFNTPYGVIDTKVVFGSSKDSSLQLTGISSPPFTEYNSTVPINKGNIATIYTDKFDDVPSLNGLEIRDLVRQRRLEEEEEAIKELTKDVIKPFKWSESEYKDEAHEGLPDLWNFGPFVPNWSW